MMLWIFEAIFYCLVSFVLIMWVLDERGLNGIYDDGDIDRANGGVRGYPTKRRIKK